MPFPFQWTGSLEKLFLMDYKQKGFLHQGLFGRVRSNSKRPLLKSPFARPQTFIRLRQNTLQLAAGMNGGANAPKLEQRPSSAVALLWRMERRVGFCEFRFDTPQLAAGRFIDKPKAYSRRCQNSPFG